MSSVTVSSLPFSQGIKNGGLAALSQANNTKINTHFNLFYSQQGYYSIEVFKLFINLTPSLFPSRGEGFCHQLYGLFDSRLPDHLPDLWCGKMG
jgi:hypothetical protein